MEKYPDLYDKELIKALSSLHDEEEVESFLRDVFTLSELKEAAKRFQIAKNLWLTDKSYLTIADEFKTSTTTVTRVADWLRNKTYGGYRLVLQRLYPKK